MVCFLDVVIILIASIRSQLIKKLEKYVEKIVYSRLFWEALKTEQTPARSSAGKAGAVVLFLNQIHIMLPRIRHSIHDHLPCILVHLVEHQMPRNDQHPIALLLQGSVAGIAAHVR